MSDSPEKEIEEFLSALPVLMQRFLQYDWACLNGPSFSQEEVLEFGKWLQDKEPETRRKYERILKRDRAKWNEYCRRAQHIDKLTASRFRIAPRAIPGRKENREIAAQIWTLRSEGRTGGEIQQILKAEGKNYSLEAIESYLKTRRRKPQE